MDRTGFFDVIENTNAYGDVCRRSGYELTYSTLNLPTRAVPRDATPFGNDLMSRGCLLESPRYDFTCHFTRISLLFVRPEFYSLVFTITFKK
jgi:hypothetical protein